MSRAQAHDHAPDCPDCETNLYVGRREGNTDGWKCWRCGGWWHDEDADEDAGRLVADGAGHVLIRPSSTRSDHIFHQPHPDHPEKPRCKVERGGTEAQSYRRRERETLDDRYRHCSYCDPEWSVERDEEDMAAYQLLDDADSLDDLRADGGEPITTQEEAVAAGQQSGKTDRERVTCPKCGEEFGNLPKHLPACDGDAVTDGGQVTIENPELFDDTVQKLKGFADNLEDVDDLHVSAGVIRDWARDLEAATRREVSSDAE